MRGNGHPVTRQAEFAEELITEESFLTAYEEPNGTCYFEEGLFHSTVVSLLRKSEKWKGTYEL